MIGLDFDWANSSFLEMCILYMWHLLFLENCVQNGDDGKFGLENGGYLGDNFVSKIDAASPGSGGSYTQADGNFAGISQQIRPPAIIHLGDHSRYVLL